MHRIKCIAWDFDGVLNRGIEAGRFVWQDLLEDAFGIDKHVFADFVFGEGFWPIMRGEKDVLHHLQDWKDHVGFEGDIHDILAFWFNEDAKPCTDMLAMMDQVRKAGLKQVIATNNEDRRTTFIEDDMGFGPRVDRVFSSGRMKVAKPDPDYFRFIENEMELKPEQLLLVDDYQENIDAARGCGWHVFHFPENGHSQFAQTIHPIL
jgi:putative hydrolase of the HAD superfamily